ncbi:MAG: preprotein translocase subunit SecE [Planctomycetia bacterium]|nr:preprotein translocase subunit SecE [Planctomycetia bacterium]
MSSFLKELVSTRMYKSAQGRATRRLTFIGLTLVFALGAFSFYRLHQNPTGVWTAVIITLLGAWISFRTVNYPTFADFLISVGAEMIKVSWPTKAELFANTKVVLVFMALFTALIFAYDVAFSLFFKLINMVF